MKNVGLALGGGAVLGAAHIGALKAIEEKNITVSHLTGTSIGALVGAFYAFGKRLDEIENISLELDWSDIAGLTLSRYGLLSNEKLGDLIVSNIGDKNIEEADIPLAFVATDVSSGEKVVLNKGSLAQAVMASTCLPGIFKPVEIEGKLLVDGGVVENVPIETLQNLGAEFMIGIDLNAKHQYGRPDNIIEVLLNSFHFMMKNATSLQTRNADLLISPDLSSFNRSDTDQVEGLMKKGYEDAISMLDEHF